MSVHFGASGAMLPRLILIITFGVALFAGTAHAQVLEMDVPEPGPDAAEVVAPFEALELSARLARLGEEAGDPWLLATAARIRMSRSVRLGTLTAESAPEPIPGTQPSVPVTSAEVWPDAARGWLDEAERLADDDPAVLSYVATIRALEFKGRTGGPLVSLSRLGGGQRQSFAERFVPGRPAVVYVEGDGDAALGVTVTTQGRTVCQNLAPGDVKLCTWTATAPGDYLVEVRNLGKATNRYAYGTN